ncbi:MAG TPA: sigma factor-like helix-turn-helix DNA-binding protein [Clostridia bacterium]|nr:sigma factor-like helix-turn-helix DNA-binding protein [Clostridia bacterium]
MKNNSWSNTLLVAFSSLPKIVKFIDFSVKSRVKSGFQSKHLRYGIQNEKLFESIIELNDEKRKICNLKVIVEGALEQLSPTHTELLRLRFFDKNTFQEIADITNVVIRTVFRRYDCAMEDFDNVLSIAGYNEEWLEAEYGSIAIFKTIKDRLEKNAYLTKSSIE